MVFVIFSTFNMFAYVLRNPYNINALSGIAMSNKMYELLNEFLKSDQIGDIPESVYRNIWWTVAYGHDGQLKRIRNHYFDNPTFTEFEMEQIFDYLKTFPPMEIPNPAEVMWDNCKGYIYKDTIMENFYKSLVEAGLDFSCLISDAKSNITNKYLMENDLDPNEILTDTLFTDMNWVEVRKRHPHTYYEEYNVDRFDEVGWKWDKIQIGSYNVYIQVPEQSQVVVADDGLSARINLPDSAYIMVNYSRGKTYVPVFDENEDPRAMNFYKMEVNNEYVLSEGALMNYAFSEDAYNSGDQLFWYRIRFRYGITVTVYSDDYLRLLNYVGKTLKTTTVSLQP